MFKLHKPLSDSIHSGHFMVSRLDDDDDDNNEAGDDSSESERDNANSVEIDVNNPDSVVDATNLSIPYSVDGSSTKNEQLASWNDLDKPGKLSQKHNQYLTYYTNSSTNDLRASNGDTAGTGVVTSSMTTTSNSVSANSSRGVRTISTSSSNVLSNHHKCGGALISSERFPSSRGNNLSLAAIVPAEFNRDLLTRQSFNSHDSNLEHQQRNDEEQRLQHHIHNLQQRQQSVTLQDYESSTKHMQLSHGHAHAVTIDLTLNTLMKWMASYYSSKLTSPKWKSFKGLKLRVKYKIRLNNLIWRAWFVQCIRGRLPPGCQFTAPVETDIHKKDETIVLEGKYWKRKEKAIVDEYRKWRRFHRQKSHFRPSSFDWDNRVSNVYENDEYHFYPDYDMNTYYNLDDLPPMLDELEQREPEIYYPLPNPIPSSIQLASTISNSTSLSSSLTTTATRMLEAPIPTSQSIQSLQPQQPSIQQQQQHQQQPQQQQQQQQNQQQQQHTASTLSIQHHQQQTIQSNQQLDQPQLARSNCNQHLPVQQMQQHPISLKSEPRYISGNCNTNTTTTNNNGNNNINNDGISISLPHAGMSNVLASGFPHLLHHQQQQQQQQHLHQHQHLQHLQHHHLHHQQHQPLQLSNRLASLPPSMSQTLPFNLENNVLYQQLNDQLQAQQQQIHQQQQSSAMSIHPSSHTLQQQQQPHIHHSQPPAQVQQQSQQPSLLNQNTYSLGSSCDMDDDDDDDGMTGSGSIRDGGSPFGSSTGPSEQRRVGHINAEQKRRCNIKNGFDTLRSILPSINQNVNVKISKASMLQKAAAHISNLTNEQKQQAEEQATLKQQIESLKQTIKNCQSQLPASGGSVGCQGSSQAREMLQDYVRRRTLENWKFWIFSLLIEPLFESYYSSVSTNSLEDACKSIINWLDRSCGLSSLRQDALESLTFLSTKTNILQTPQTLPTEAVDAVKYHNQETGLQSCPTGNLIAGAHQQVPMQPTLLTQNLLNVATHRQQHLQQQHQIQTNSTHLAHQTTTTSASSTTAVTNQSNLVGW